MGRSAVAGVRHRSSSLEESCFYNCGDPAAEVAV